MHRTFIVAALLGLFLRAVVMAAYRPALWFHGDSFSYLARGADLSTHPVRPMGYAVLLRIFEPLPHSLVFVMALQHLLGLGIAVLLYALLVRHAVPRWAATLATAPVLLDAYQLQVEHLVMSDVPFAFLVVTATGLLVWSDRTRPAAAAAAGVLLGAAAVTRSIGLPAAVVIGLALVVRRVGARALVVAALSFAVPLVSYAAWFHAEHGRWALTNSNGVFLYSRVMAFADCSVLPLSPPERRLCDPREPQDRPESSRYIWDPSPLRNLPGPVFTPENNALAMTFARKAVRHQPVDYARQVVKELGYTFALGRVRYPSVDVGKYQFTSDPSQLVPPYGRAAALRQVQAYEGLGVPTLDSTADRRLAGWLQAYQRFAYVRGPVVAVLVLLTLAAGLPGRSPHGQGRGSRAAALMLGAVAATLLVVPPMTAQFDHRYVLTALPPLSAAAALGGTLLAHRLRPHWARTGWYGAPTPVDADPGPSGETPAGDRGR